MSDESTRRAVLGPADLAEGTFRGYRVGKRNVLVVHLDGRYVAMDDWCNHAGCLLSGGWLHERTVVCPCHEIGFEVLTGRNVTSPGIADDQRVYPLEVEDGQLVVIGFPEV